VERLEEKIRFPCVFFLSGRGAVRKREEETGGKGGEEEETERRTRRPARGLRLRLPVDPLLRSSVDHARSRSYDSRNHQWRRIVLLQFLMLDIY
jgi:hypothetical protein